MKDDTVKRKDVIDLLMHECSASTAGKLIDKVNDLQSGEKPKTDGELVKKKLAIRAFATYLRDSALIDYPDAGDTVEDWIPTAESVLKDVPTEMPLIIHCTECKDWHERQGIQGVIASHWKPEQPEIIMCKNCKHYKFADDRAFGFPVKRCEWTGCEDVEDNDFCSRAERQEDEEV